MSALLLRGARLDGANEDVDLLRGVEALLELRERWRDRLRLQVAPFLTGGATRAGAPAREWLEEAMRLGGDVVSANPTHAARPAELLDMLFDVAERCGKPVDVH